MCTRITWRLCENADSPGDFVTMQGSKGLMHYAKYWALPLQGPSHYNDNIEPSHFCAPCNDFPQVL